MVSEEKVSSLPLNGRSFVTLITLVPAVALPPGQAFPRINGGRPRTNDTLFDGISVLQPEPGQVAFFPVVDAIQEFKVETNSPPAEFGRFNGGVVNLTTKAGTNVLHGTAFEFFRHEALNARNFFQTANATKPGFRRNQFGVLGGPVLRNRTFFFADYQGQRQDIERTVFSTVPTMAQRQGVFTQNIYDPATTTPNGAGGFTRTQFRTTRSRSSGWIRWRASCCCGIRSRRRRARPTTISARRARSTIRISGMSGWITCSRRTAIARMRGSPTSAAASNRSPHCPTAAGRRPERSGRRTRRPGPSRPTISTPSRPIC